MGLTRTRYRSVTWAYHPSSGDKSRSAVFQMHCNKRVALLSCFAKASQDGALYNLTRKSGPASLAAVQRASQGHSAKLASGERSRVESAGIEPAGVQSQMA